VSMDRGPAGVMEMHESRFLNRFNDSRFTIILIA
jgi:hypothetical protein